jgi:hypothetical protein
MRHRRARTPCTEVARSPLPYKIRGAARVAPIVRQRNEFRDLRTRNMREKSETTQRRAMEAEAISAANQEASDALVREQFVFGQQAAEIIPAPKLKPFHFRHALFETSKESCLRVC